MISLDKALHLVPSKLSSTVWLLGDELGAEDIHLLVTRVLHFGFEYCRAAAVLSTTVSTLSKFIFKDLYISK